MSHSLSLGAPLHRSLPGRMLGRSVVKLASPSLVLSAGHDSYALEFADQAPPLPGALYQCVTLYPRNSSGILRNPREFKGILWNIEHIVQNGILRNRNLMESNRILSRSCAFLIPGISCQSPRRPIIRGRLEELHARRKQVNH